MPEDRDGVGSIHRAVDVLSAFSHEEPELPLSAIAAKAALPKPTAFRILSTLKRRGLVAQNEASGRYSLGFGILALAAVRTGQTNVRDQALPVMRRMRDVANETVVLSVRVGDHRVQIEQVEGLLPIRRTVVIGERVPLYAGGASKILLAGMADDELREYLGHTRLQAYGPSTTTDKDKLLAEVEAIRERGYTEGINERNLGGVGVAAPVRDFSGAVVAAVHISVPQFRYSDEIREQCIQAVLDGTRRLSEKLGYQ